MANYKTKTKLTLGTEIDHQFNDQDLQQLSTKKSRTLRTTNEREQKNFFYQKPTLSQIIRFRPANSLVSSQISLKRCTSHGKTVKCESTERQQRLQSVIIKTMDQPRTAHFHSETLPMHRFYEIQSFLNNNHETLVNQISQLPPSMKQLLHTNLYLIIDSEEKNAHIDESLIFVLYNVLHQLDKDVLEKLFSTGDPALNFKIKYLSDSVQITSEMIVMAIRQALLLDHRLAKFFEGFWKFWVVLVDLAMQWMQKSSSDYLTNQVQDIIDKMNQALKDKQVMEDKLMESQKEWKALEKSLERQIESLKKEVDQVQSEFSEYKSTLKEMSDLRIAETRMNQVGLKTLELERIIKQFDQSAIANRIGIQKDFKDLASVLVQRRSQQTPSYQYAQQQLGCYKCIDDRSIGILLTLHPFAFSYMREKADLNCRQVLLDFWEYLTQIDEMTADISLIFKEWLQDQSKLNQVITHIIDSHTIDVVSQLFSSIFGIANQPQISPTCLKKMCVIYKQLVDEHEINLESQLIMKDMMPYLQLSLNEDFVQTLDMSNLTLCELLNRLGQFITQLDRKLPIDNPLHVNLRIVHNWIDSSNDCDEVYRQIIGMHPQLLHRPALISPRQKIQMAVRRVSQRSTSKIIASSSPLKRGSATTKSIKK